MLRGDTVKDDSRAYALFTEQSSSPSQKTAAGVMDVFFCTRFFGGAPLSSLPLPPHPSPFDSPLTSPAFLSMRPLIFLSMRPLIFFDAPLLFFGASLLLFFFLCASHLLVFLSVSFCFFCVFFFLCLCASFGFFGLLCNVDPSFFNVVFFFFKRWLLCFWNVAL